MIRVYVVENLIFLNALLDPPVVDTIPIKFIDLADVLPYTGVISVVEHYIVSFRVIRHDPTSIFRQHLPNLFYRLPFFCTRVAVLDYCKCHSHEQVALYLILNVAAT